MYKAFIFDLDGTLLDTLPDLKNSINEALKINGYNISYTYEETMWLVGSGIKMLCRRAINKFDPTDEEVERLFADFTRIYKERQLDETRLYKNVKNVLFSLKKDGFKVCVLSNKVEKNVKEILKFYLPDFTFDIVVGQRANVPIKPDPTSLNNIIEELEITREEILYVGDSDVDMIVASNASIDCVGVTYGYRPKEILEKYNPKYLIDDILEILEIVKNK